MDHPLCLPPYRKADQSATDKTVYILFTRSTTWFSRLIHLVSAGEYTHVSIGLESETGPYVSFARRYPRLPLPAGMILEKTHSGYFRLHPDTPCAVIALDVSEAAYWRIADKIQQMYGQKHCYRYNILGTFACLFHIRWSRSHHYFCSEFVAEALKESGAVQWDVDPSLTRPMDLYELAEHQVIFRGNVAGIGEMPPRSAATA